MQRLCHPGPCLHTWPLHLSPAPAPPPADSRASTEPASPMFPPALSPGIATLPRTLWWSGPFPHPPDKVLAPEKALGGARIGGYLAPSMLWRPLVLGCGVTGQGGASHR